MNRDGAGKTANIFLNGRFLSQTITGVQRYAFELIAAIDRHLSAAPALRGKYCFTLLVPPDVSNIPVLTQIAVKQVGRFKGQLWEQVELPFHSRGGLLAGFCNTGPLLKGNQVVTLCDASVYKVPKAYSLAFRLWYRTVFAVVGHRSRGLLTISDFSRDELVQCCHLSPEKFSVVYPGVNHAGWLEDRGPQGADDLPAGRPFLLAVSSMSPHKNFKALVDAISLLGETDFDVIVAGGTNPAIFKDARLPLPKTVRHLGYVSDARLKELYSKAACFIYPSLYEGFGLPPLEAMANGCPVIAARAGSLPEVCGDAALYCDPCSVEDIAQKIQMVMTDGRLRAALRSKGLERAQMYTWEECAELTVKMLERFVTRGDIDEQR